MNVDFDLDSVDTLDAIAVPTGILVALVGLATLAGTPWAYGTSTLVTVGRILGAVGTVVFGLALAWFVYTAK